LFVSQIPSQWTLPLYTLSLLERDFGLDPTRRILENDCKVHQMQLEQ